MWAKTSEPACKPTEPKRMFGSIKHTPRNAVQPLLPGTLPVLAWFAEEHGFAGATH